MQREMWMPQFISLIKCCLLVRTFYRQRQQQFLHLKRSVKAPSSGRPCIVSPVSMNSRRWPAITAQAAAQEAAPGPPAAQPPGGHNKDHSGAARAAAVVMPVTCEEQQQAV